MIPRRTTIAAAFAAVFATAAGLPAAATAQQPALGREAITTLAKVQVAISARQDSINPQLAHPRNKKDENQTQLKATLQAEIAAILASHGLTSAEYARQTFVVSTDSAARHVFDSTVVALTGAPLPGMAPAAAPAAGAAAMPAGPVGTHLGHVVNAFGDTPNRVGLLPAAMADARVAIQHAQLASRQPTNLDYMKTHAAHVIHAIDPSVEATGPGSGYGVKKAALGVATHIELAAAAEGASGAHVLHAGHVAVSARNTVTRADQIVALAQRVRSAGSAADAASLISQIVSLTQQLVAGADVNGDGRITWEMNEGGLQHCDEHVKLMLAGGR